MLSPSRLIVEEQEVTARSRYRRQISRGRWQAGKLAQSYGELQRVLTEMKNVARNSAVLNMRFATNESRIVELERGLQKLSIPPLPTTNDVPSFSSEPPDAPKP